MNSATIRAPMHRFLLILFAASLLSWQPAASKPASGDSTGDPAVLADALGLRSWASGLNAMTLSDLPKVLEQLRNNDQSAEERRMTLTVIGAIAFLGFLFFAAWRANRGG